MQVLSRLGYANTGLRDIAKQSGFSLGVLHYYFKNKDELITYCVKSYKEKLLATLVQTINASSDLDALAGDFIALLRGTLGSPSDSHRLWYDIRAQALFSPQFRAEVDALEEEMTDLFRVYIQRHEYLTGQSSEMTPLMLYLQVEACFRYAYQQLHSHEGQADVILDKFEQQVRSIFQTL